MQESPYRPGRLEHVSSALLLFFAGIRTTSPLPSHVVGLANLLIGNSTEE